VKGQARWSRRGEVGRRGAKNSYSVEDMVFETCQEDNLVST
jgi:hypothetical protein